MQKRSLMHSSTSHMAPHIRRFPYVSQKVASWTVNQSSTVRPSGHRLGDLRWILQAAISFGQKQRDLWLHSDDATTLKVDHIYGHAMIVFVYDFNLSILK